jgi:hypothetical protein
MTTLYIEVRFKTKSPRAFQNLIEMRLASFKHEILIAGSTSTSTTFFYKEERDYGLKVFCR